MWDFRDGFCKWIDPRPPGCWDKGENCVLLINPLVSIQVRFMTRKMEDGCYAVNVQPAEPQIGWIRLVKENFGFIRIEVSLSQRTCANIKLWLSLSELSGRRWGHFLPLERGRWLRHAQEGWLGAKHHRVERSLGTMERHQRKWFQSTDNWPRKLRAEFTFAPLKFKLWESSKKSPKSRTSDFLKAMSSTRQTLRSNKPTLHPEKEQN